jgi:hypothetical protein
VRIEYGREGGLAYIPALAAPVVIETSALGPEEGRALEELVRKAAFFDLPSEVGAPRSGAADYYTYTVSIDDQGRSNRVRIVDVSDRPEVADLVRALQKVAKEMRRQQ